MSLAPIYEGGVRKNRDISIPANLRMGPEHRLTAGYTASNSYLNPGRLICRTGAQVCQLDYATDHTGNLLFVNASLPLLQRWEFGFGLGMYRMEEIPRWALPQRFASDRLLRWFHEDMLGEESLPEKSQAPDGRQQFSLTDFSGRTLTLAEGGSYLLPLRVDFSRYVALRQTDRVGMGLNASIHLSQPLEGDPGVGLGESAFARGLAAGVSVNWIRNRWLSTNVSSTYHIQLAWFRSDVHVVNENSPVNSDDSNRSQYVLSYGLRFNGTFGGRAPCSLVLSQVSNSAHYDKETYWTIDPLVFEGGNNLRGALAGANDYGAVSFGCERGRRSYQISLVEDIAGLSQLIDDDGAGTSYDPDFAVSVSVSWALGRDAAERD